MEEGVEARLKTVEPLERERIAPVCQTGLAWTASVIRVTLHTFEREKRETR